MQPVYGFRIDEARYGVGTALDQQALEAQVEERADDRLRVKLARFASEPHDLDAVGGWRIRGANDESWHAVVRKTACPGRQSAGGVNHHACWASPRHTADTEQRIVGQNGSDPHHHGVDRRTQAMHVIKGFWMIDPAAFAARRGNAAIE